MNPIKYKTIVKKVIEEKGYDETLVNDLLDWYWQNIRKALSNPTTVNIEVYKLGYFNIRPKAVYSEMMYAYNQFISTKQPKIKESRKQRYMEYLEISKIITHEHECRKKIWSKKAVYRAKYIEEQAANNGSLEKQSIQEGSCGDHSGTEIGDMSKVSKDGHEG